MQVCIDAYYKSLNKIGEELCGDKVEIIRTEKSIILVLADGLGSGVKANILSTLTSKIIGTMLKGGATVEEAVETIANTLPVCNVRKLAYSTFSILEIFYDGKAVLVEFDNPSCVFIRDGKLMDLPFLNIEISGKKLKRAEFDVKINDVFVIFSDGVVHAGVGQTLNLGWEWVNVAKFLKEDVPNKKSALRIASSLSSVCDNLYMGMPGDDTTVLAAKILEEKVIDLFTGPPINPDKDSVLIADFMKDKLAKKVVCGGTSANILSREIDKEIETSLDYFDPSIPPIATIDGIDLVTEGVLTISATVELLNKFAKNEIDVSYIESLDKKNGASLLSKMLIEDCTTLNLYVGKAINPAHQNPNLPVDLSIKLRLIDKLICAMEQLGKKVKLNNY